VDLGAIREGDLRLRKQDASDDEGSRAPEKEDEDDDEWD
jgi:hypothetical protein